MSQQVPLLKSRVVPPAIGVADQTSGVCHQNQALRIAQNLAGKITLPVQFGLIGTQTGHIEHQSAHLQQPPQIVVEAKGIDQDVNGRSVLAPQSRLKITQVTALLHRSLVAVPVLE